MLVIDMSFQLLGGWPAVLVILAVCVQALVWSAVGLCVLVEITVAREGLFAVVADMWWCRGDAGGVNLGGHTRRSE